VPVFESLRRLPPRVRYKKLPNLWLSAPVVSDRSNLDVAGESNPGYLCQWLLGRLDGTVVSDPVLERFRRLLPRHHPHRIDPPCNER
jgi:hypothetical protein